MLLLARTGAVGVASLGAQFSRPARGLIAVSMPRGMAAGVLAMMPLAAGVPGTEELPVIVFACVLGTILMFAGAFPVFKSKLQADEAASALADAQATAASVESPDLGMAHPLAPSGAVIDGLPPTVGGVGASAEAASPGGVDPSQ